jgi:tripartite-type tricarboxylate transporter receptor subunit TctC
MLFDRVINIRFGFLLAIFIALWIASFSNISPAADYPSKPIQMIVAFPPGGGTDIIARLVSVKVSALLAQPVVVLNKPGGGGTLGTYAALAALPDGYTILSVSPPMISAPMVTKGVTFNLFRDFTMINWADSSPIVLIVKKDSPWLTLEELIADAKKNPGKLTVSIAGYGSSAHFAAELFKIHTGTDITCVPMDGTTPLLTAVLGGHLNMGATELGPAHSYLEAGSLRALAVMAKKRLKDFPGVPTTVEKGFPNLIAAVWHGFVVRAETPREIVGRLEKVFKEALKEKEIIGKLEKMGIVVENFGTKEGTEFIAGEQQMCLDVTKAANIVPK